MGEEDVIDRNFGENMKRRREHLGLAKAHLLRRLEGLGWETVHQTTITRIEDGKRAPRLGEAQLIADALDTRLENLLTTPKASSLYDALSTQNGVVFEAAMAARKADREFDREQKKLAALIEQMDERTEKLFDGDELEDLRWWGGRGSPSDLQLDDDAEA